MLFFAKILCGLFPKWLQGATNPSSFGQTILGAHFACEKKKMSVEKMTKILKNAVLEKIR